MNARLRACHLIHRFQPGGAEDVLVEFAHVAPTVGIELTVYALVGETDTLHGKALRAAGAEVGSLGLPSRWDPRGLSRGVAAVRRARPDVVHTHLKHADIVGGRAATRLGVPHVSTLHVIEDDVALLGSVKRRLAATVRGRAADRIIAVSDAQRRWYAERYPEQARLLTTVHNGVRPVPPVSAARRAELRAELGASPDDVLVLSASVMRPGKGHDTLLAAIRRLPAEPAVRVALAGDGELRDHIEREVATDPLLAARVRMLGFRTDVPELLRASDVLVQPSDLDALPTVLMHAQAAGVATVATDVGGIPEIVTPGSGILVPARSPGALADALGTLVRSPERRAAAGRAGAARFAAEFDATVWARRLRAIYDDMLHPATHDVAAGATTP